MAEHQAFNLGMWVRFLPASRDALCLLGVTENAAGFYPADRGSIPRGGRWWMDTKLPPVYVRGSSRTGEWVG